MIGFHMVIKVNNLLDTMRTLLLVIISLMHLAYMQLEVIFHIGLVATLFTMECPLIALTMHYPHVLPEIYF